MASTVRDGIRELSKFKSHKVIIFGGTGGLGRAIGRLLASSGIAVTVVGRTFRDARVENINFVEADLSSIKYSIEVAKSMDVSQTNVILFTTGIFASKQRQETEEGLERDMAVSYLNRLAILDILAPKLTTSSGFKPRVFFMGYPGFNQLGSLDDLNQEKSYNFYTTHMNTVAGNEALVFYGKRKYPNANFYGLNPGMVPTRIRSNLVGEGWLGASLEYVLSWLFPTAEQYAQKVTPVLFSPTFEDQNGAIIGKSGERIPSSKGFTEEHAMNFIAKSKELLESKRLGY